MRHGLPVVFALAVLLGRSAAALPPGEVTGVKLAAGSRSLQWDPAPGASEYRVYRGDRASLPDLLTPLPETCRVGTYAVTESGPVLEPEPPPGDFHWYVVTAANADGEGPAGPGGALDPWGGCCGEVALAEDFAGPGGTPWHGRWAPAFEVADSDLSGGGGRWRPRVSGYSLARFYSHADERDVEVTFRFRFEDVARQGVGFYVRQNRGYLTQTSPPGQGYAVFVEGFRGSAIGVWKEENGSEIELDVRFDPTLDLRDGIDYRVRFRCLQEDAASTRLSARVWPDGSLEPAGWQVDFVDRTPVLQGTRGGIGVDSWNTITPGTPGSPTPAYTFIDDVRLVRVCNPIDGAGAIQTVAETFQFTEGPLWRAGELFFTDINADTIYRWDGVLPAAVHRSPSQRANGLATGADASLLACQHQSRSVTREDAGGAVTTVADRYQGLRLNSPNDLAVRGDGSFYFSDPPYGLASPGDRELPYNGLFRWSPEGGLTLEWSGDAALTAPNGVALSPDQTVLYLADSVAGTVLAFDVDPSSGRLTRQRTFASGLNVPDGMCIDMAGNVYVATWASTVEVFAPDGQRWGAVAIPRQATNCAFGGADRRRLFVTAQQGLYYVDLPQPGCREALGRSVVHLSL